MKKIAIIGSTGMLGKPVTNAFINAGFEVRILARNPEKAKGIFGTKVHVIKGDLEDVNSLKEFMSGQSDIYLNLSVKQSSGVNEFQAQREGLKNILKAAKVSNVKRIGYLSSLVQSYTGNKWWVLEISKEAVNHIKRAGLSYSIFYPSTFMESFDKGAFRQGNRIILAGKSKFPMYLIAGSDYGKQVVEAFEKDKGNNEYVVQGPDGYITDDAAKLFADNYKKAKLKVSILPLGVLKFFGLFTNKFNYAANIVDALNNYPEKFEAEKTWLELGKPQTKLIDYIKSCK